MSVNKYFSRYYDDESYNCLHFVREVWLDEVGEDLQAKFEGLLSSVRSLKPSHFKVFERLPKPQSPCIVFMSQLGQMPHVGVYLRGKILHIKRKGVEFLPPSLVLHGATSVRYYR